MIIALALENLLAGKSNAAGLNHAKQPTAESNSDAIASIPNLTQRLQAGGTVEKSGPNLKMLGIVAVVLAVIGLIAALQ
jgi:hypothetical protein